MQIEAEHPITPGLDIDARCAANRMWTCWLAAFAAALALYALTAAREIGWQDYGHYVQRVVEHELVNPLGLALSHPLYYWLGRFAVDVLPATPPHAAALVSALLGAITVANVCGIVRNITSSTTAAALAAAGLALAHTFWRMSTMAESYATSTAFLTAEMWTLLLWDRTRRPKWLIVVFLLNGIGFSNHNFALLELPVIGVILLTALVRRELRWQGFALAGLLWGLGASLYLGLIVHQIAETGQVGATLHSALFGHGYAGSVLSTRLPLKHVAVSAAFTVLSFANLMLPAAILGIARGRGAGMPRLTHWAMLLILLIQLIFVVRYDVQDQYTFMLPAYALIAIFAGVGYAVVLTRWPSRKRAVAVTAAIVLTLGAPALYAALAPVARHYQVLGSAARNKPYRDDYRYLFIPWGCGDNSAGVMSRRAVDLAAPDGLLIVEDGMAMFAVQYERFMRGKAASRIDLVKKAEFSRVAEALDAGHRVVLVPASADREPMSVPGRKWRREGDLYVVDAP